MKNEFDNGGILLDLAATFSEIACSQRPGGDRYARALYRAAKDESAGRNEALFVLASFLASRTKTNDARTHRMAVDVIDSIFDSIACEFMCYEEYLDFAALVAERMRGVDFNSVLGLFNNFEDIRNCEDLIA